MDFYSDSDRTAVAWLRELIRDGLIPGGIVDERPIQELTGADLRGFARVHLFAGIGGWPHALDLAGWPRDRPVWTGSCPCQPFSAAGKRRGEEDERHLWPVFLRLIRECRPPVCLGEQVASDDGYRWLAGVRDDLEEAGYAVGCADLPACCAGAPHIRQRLFWVAHAKGRSRENGAGFSTEGRPMVGAGSGAGGRAGSGTTAAGTGGSETDGGEGGLAGRLADTQGDRLNEQCRAAGRANEAGGPGHGKQPLDCRRDGRLADADGRQPGDGGLQPGREHGQQPEDGGVTGGVGHSVGAGRQGRGAGFRGEPVDGAGGEPVGPAGGGPGFWDRYSLVPCRDGKARRVGAGLQPLAHGIFGRVGLLRGAGNAIVPQAAAKFIRAVMDVIDG